jgi:hypothetical protein
VSRPNANTLLDEFSEWLSEGHPDDGDRNQVVAAVRGVLHHATHIDNAGPTLWDVERVPHVIEHIIEDESLDDDDVEPLLHAFGDYLRFLDDTDQLDPDSDDYDALDNIVAELDDHYGPGAGWRISLPKDVEIPPVVLAPEATLLEAAEAGSLKPEEDTLEGWETAFRGRLDVGVLTAVADGEPSQWAQMLETVVVDLLVVLYMRGSITRKEFDELGWAVTAGAVTKRSQVEKRQIQRLHTEADADITELVEQLKAIGVVTGEGTDDDRVKLTPLGRWEVNRLLREREYAAPTVTDLDDPSAAKLLKTLPELRADDMGDVLEAWVARRQPSEVVSELADLVESTAVDSSDPEGDRLAIALALFRDAIELLPDTAEADVRAALDRTVLHGLVSSWLTRRVGATDVRLDLADDVDKVVVALAPLVLSGREVDAVALVDEAGDPSQQLQFIETLWRRPEADSGAVLTALADFHTDKKVAKAAKKAAFKRRSAGLP